MRMSLAAVRGNCGFLRQGIALVERIPTETYRTRARAGWEPVGAQFRHVLDHYRCFLGGLADRRINYDARLRERRIETDPALACTVARTIIEALEMIHVEEGDRGVMVQMDAGGSDGVPDWRPSTVGRELQFLASHTVHHYALIKVLVEDLGFEAPAGFGVAPATLAYQRSGVGARSRGAACSGNSGETAGVPAPTASVD